MVKGKKVVRHPPQRTNGTIKETDVYFRTKTNVYSTKQRMKKLLETKKEINVYAMGPAIKKALAALALLKRDNVRLDYKIHKQKINVIDEVFSTKDAESDENIENSVESQDVCTIPKIVERKSHGIHIVVTVNPL